MGCLSTVFLVLGVLSVTTPALGLPRWSRRPPQRGLSGAMVTPGRRPPRLGASSLRTRARTQPISGRNKLLMDHLQLSMNRGGPRDASVRPESSSRTRFRTRQQSRLYSRVALNSRNRKVLGRPNIDFRGLKKFSSHQMRPVKNIRLAPFLRGFGRKTPSRGLPSHRKREHQDSEDARARIETNAYILTSDIKGAPSHSDTRQSFHDHSYGDGQYASAADFLARNPSVHLFPCDAGEDRYKCLNGGVCVHIGALDTKTCRCPPQYTGIRCEMVDQEYLISIYTNSRETS